jgi:hypothetical protein
MDPATRLAAAAREAAPGDSGREGSRRSLGVTWGEVRVAAWLSVVCAITAALVAVPAGAAELLVPAQIWATFGEGVSRKETFRDRVRMERREPFIVDFDWSTPRTRSQHALAGAWNQSVILLFFPVCYVAYLGASLRVCCPILGSVVLTLATVMAGFVLSGNNAALDYSPGLGFALLVVALRLLCPRGSRIPVQAIKQALVVLVGNVLIKNVIPETTVRTALLS